MLFMRIDAYNQIAQLYGVQNTYNNNNSRSGKTASMSSDQLSISSAGYSHQTAKNAVSEASDVREDKIARLKAQIQAGTYSVDPEAFANKLLENYSAVF
jgi:negative regulator of flagellin synthesis FlgM